MEKRLLLIVVMFLMLGRGFAQDNGKTDFDYKSTKITIKSSGKTLGELLNEISTLANVKFLFSQTVPGIQQITTVNYVDVPLETVLNELLAGAKVKLNFNANRLVEVDATGGLDNKGVWKVGGQVIGSDDKKPIPGATILINDGSGKGTIADADGRFEVMVPNKTSISISFIGYETITKLIEKPESITFTLKAGGTDLKDVVVTGMSKRNKESFTGGYVTVKGEELRKFSPNNILKALQYFDPSFKLMDNISRGSDPNAELQFQIRGDAALGGTGTANNMDLMLDNVASRPNVPLFVLDGFIVAITRITSLDPERVESVTILKDAASTAIYGSRAANGVIVIETKVAPEGALSISYGTNIGVQTPDLSDYNLLDASGKLALEMQAGVYELNNAASMNSYNQYKRDILSGVNSYWLSQPLRTAITQRHSLTLAGGTQAFRYGLGLNVAGNPGVMKGSSRDTKGVNFNMQYRQGNWNIGASIDVSDVKGDNSPYGDFSAYSRMNPYYKITDANGDFLKVLDNKSGGIGIGSQVITNPLYNTQFKQKDFTKSLSLSNNLNLEYSPLTNLHFTTRVSYVRGVASEERFKPASHTDFELVDELIKRGSYTKNNGESASWSADLGSNYNIVTGKHTFSLFGNFTIAENTSNYVNLSALGFPDENMDDFLFGTELDQRVAGTEATSRNLGLTGQFSYAYDSRYSADFNIRADASSQFGADRRIAPFWSSGVRWNAHQEKWLQGIVPSLVLRASYGLTGAQSYEPYQAVEFYSFTNLMFPYASFGVLGAELRGLGNSELGWSKTSNASVSMDLGLWQNRLNVTGSYYNNITRQMLVDFTLAPSTGFDSRTFNAGELQNRGMDVAVSVMPVQDLQKRLQWNITANANRNINKIRKISNALKKMNETQLATTGAPLPVYEEGQSTSTLYLVRSLGIDPVSGREVYLTRDNKRTYVWNAADKVPVGDTNPKVSGSITSSLTLGNISLGLGMQYRLGGYSYNSTLVDKIENSDIIYNMDRRALDERWTTPGQASYYKKYDLAQSEMTPSSTRFLMKLNEFKLNNVTLGYRMRAEDFTFLRKANMSVVNINFGTEELMRLATVRQERGLSFPFARTYNLSVSVLFR